jgi:hypothetical protein
MSTAVSFNGSSFTVPSTGEEDWGGSDGVDGLLVSLANNALSKAGGTFTLNAEVDFGGTAGLKASYLKSRGSNVSTSGIIRLANTEAVSWRNAANSADLALAVDASNNLTFSGSVVIPATIGTADTVLTSNGTSAAWAKLVNANIDAAAAIARTKIATGTASHVIINDGSGVLSSEATLAKSRGGTAQDNSSLTFPATGTLATLAGTEVLTNKDIDGGTASNAKRITLPKDTLANIQALTRKEGTLWYATDVDKLYSDDGASLNQVGSGAGGSINYILNPDSETGTTGWAAYADAAGSSPVDGTGGSPTATITRTTSSPLRGTGSFLVTKDAANRQGEGTSYAFTIDSADQAKVLNISFDYAIASGTFVSGDSSDIRVYVYDVTNSVLIQPAPYTIQGGSSGNWKFTGTFQSASNSTSYRLILHIATTSTSAWTFKFDNVVVGPQITLLGALVTDWQGYTPTFTGLGTVSGTLAFWRRVGDSLEIKIETTSGTCTGVKARASLPSGLSIDSTKLSSVSNTNIVGMGARNSSTGAGTLTIIIDTSTSTTEVFMGTDNATGNQQLSALNGNVIFDNSQRLNFAAKIPILGWGSSMVVSNDTDTRVVAATYSLSSNNAPGANTQINFDTKIIDTHNAVTTGAGAWKFTAPMPGNYQILTNVKQASATAFDSTLFLNGSTYVLMVQLNANGDTKSGCATLSLSAGDTVDLRISAAGTVGGGTSPRNSIISINRLSGPATIAASESVNARYIDSAGTSLTNATFTIVNFSSWKFTAPVAGKYSVSTVVGIQSSGSWSAGERAIMRLFKNGSDGNHGNFDVYYSEGGSTTAVNLNGTTTISLLAGDYIDVRIDQNTGLSQSLSADANYNHISIERIGN